MSEVETLRRTYLEKSDAARIEHVTGVGGAECLPQQAYGRRQSAVTAAACPSRRATSGPGVTWHSRIVSCSDAEQTLL